MHDGKLLIRKITRPFKNQEYVTYNQEKNSNQKEIQKSANEINRQSL